MATHNGSHVKFVFMKTGRSRVLSLPSGSRRRPRENGATEVGADFSCANEIGATGVGAIGGRDDLGIVAWAELRERPNVHVLQYASPIEVKLLQGTDCAMNYK